MSQRFYDTFFVRTTLLQSKFAVVTREDRLNKSAERFATLRQNLREREAPINCGEYARECKQDERSGASNNPTHANSNSQQFLDGND